MEKVGKYRVYGEIMQGKWVDEKPVQPKREDRKFLRYPPKPPLVPVEKKENVQLVEIPIMFRTPIEGIKLDTLQFWLDHLGEAIYNPLQGVTIENGVYNFRDGMHRTRCLWEIGEPSVRILLWTGPPKESIDISMNVRETARTHFRADRSIKRVQFYPCIYPVPTELVNFYNTREGEAYKELIDTPVSFRDIVTKMPNKYRLPTLEAVLERVDIKGKRVFDVGCRDGWISLCLWEAGADEVVAFDRLQNYTRAVELMAGRRIGRRDGGRVVTKCLTIQEFLQKDESRFDVVLLLNILHHLLVQGKDEGWHVLRTLLERSGVVFVMTRNFEEVYEEFGRNIELALRTKTRCKVEFILKCGERELFMLRKK